MSNQFSNDDFQAVRVGKVSELIAQQIKTFILSGGLKAGDRLPPERELVVRFEASRNSVREAIRILEALGLLTIKRGSGVYVTALDGRPVTDALSSMLKVGNVTIHQLTQARLVMEPGAARLACESVTSEHLKKLEENIKQATTLAKSGSPAFRENVIFHTLVAEATGNPVIVLMMKTLLEVAEQAGGTITRGSPTLPEWSLRVVNSHKKIVAAFKNKNAQLAHERMFQHILEVEKALREQMNSGDE